jgi:glycerate kinase
VARAAKKYGLPVIGLAGNVPKEPNKNLNEYFEELLSINNQTSDLATAFKNAKINLTNTACEWGNMISSKKK